MLRPNRTGVSAPGAPMLGATTPASTPCPARRLPPDRSSTTVCAGPPSSGSAVLHVGAAIGVLWIVMHRSTPTLVLAAALYVLCGLSMTAGYHRLFAHRTFRASAPVRWTMLVFGAATFQNSAVSWSADHRAHHADTDGDHDPHAITRGVWYAHIGWLFRRRVASADVSRLGDLWSLRSVRLQHRWYAVVAIGVGLLLPAAIGLVVGRPVGWVVRRRVPPRGRHAPGHVLHQLARPPHRARRATTDGRRHATAC